MKRLRLKLELHLVALCALLVLTLGALLSTLAYLRLEHTADVASREAFDAIAAGARNDVDADEQTIRAALRLVAVARIASVTAAADRLARENVLIGLLGASSSITAAYIGYPDGGLLFARRQAGGTLVRLIDRTHGVHAVRRLVAPGGAIIAQGPETHDLIDPRTRPWFTDANTHVVARTAPYRFGTSGGIGYSISIRSPAGSVVAVSVSQADASQALAHALTDPRTVAAIFDERNRVLARSTSDPAALAALQAASTVPLDTPRANRVLLGDEPLLARRDHVGDGRILVTAMQQADLSGAYRTIRDRTIALSVTILALSIPLTWFIGRRIARPLVRLADDAFELRRLDFAQRPIPHSNVSEIDALAETFGRMRERMSRFTGLSTAIALESDLQRILAGTLSEIVDSLDGEAGVAYLADANGTLRPEASFGMPETPTGEPPTYGLALRAGNAREPLQRKSAADDESLGDAFAQLGHQPIRVLALPFVNRLRAVVAVVLIARRSEPERPFSDAAAAYGRAFAGLTAIALEAKRYRDDLARYNDAAGHFVPTALLAQMDYGDITAVELGHYRTRSMTVLATDIRSFTTISEALGTQRTFAFLNRYLGRAAAAVRACGGVVDRYVGDAIIALFPNGVTDAVRAAIALQVEVRELRRAHEDDLPLPLATGVGLDDGEVLLGTIGEPERLATAAISRTVARAELIESRTAVYGAPILISAAVAVKLDPEIVVLRRFPREHDEHALELYEVCDADEVGLLAGKRALRDDFELAVRAAEAGRDAEAAARFGDIARALPDDRPAAYLRDRYAATQRRPTPVA